MTTPQEKISRLAKYLSKEYADYIKSRDYDNLPSKKELSQQIFYWGFDCVDWDDYCTGWENWYIEGLLKAKELLEK